MDGVQWKPLLKWMILGYHYFWKHPYSTGASQELPTNKLGPQPGEISGVVLHLGKAINFVQCLFLTRPMDPFVLYKKSSNFILPATWSPKSFKFSLFTVLYLRLFFPFSGTPFNTCVLGHPPLRSGGKARIWRWNSTIIGQLKKKGSNHCYHCWGQGNFSHIHILTLLSLPKTTKERYPFFVGSMEVGRCYALKLQFETVATASFARVTYHERAYQLPWASKYPDLVDGDVPGSSRFQEAEHVCKLAYTVVATHEGLPLPCSPSRHSSQPQVKCLSK